jgi:hypothetical protein
VRDKAGQIATANFREFAFCALHSMRAERRAGARGPGLSNLLALGADRARAAPPCHADLCPAAWDWGRDSFA